jgi:hypothetical protein
MFILILLFFNGNVPLLHVGPVSLLVISVFKISAIHFFVYPFAKYHLRYLKLIFPKKLMYRMLEEILQNNLFSQFSTIETQPSLRVCRTIQKEATSQNHHPPPRSYFFEISN